MLLNILYYDQANEAKNQTQSASLSFGPLYVTAEQITIGFIVEFLAFVPSLLLVQLFRRTKARDSRSPLEKAFTSIQHEQPLT